MNKRHIAALPVSVFLIAAVTLGNPFYIRASSLKKDKVIESLDISVEAPLCGTWSDTSIEWYPYLKVGEEYPEKEDAVEVLISQWMIVEKEDKDSKDKKKKDKKDKKDKEEKLIPFEGTFTGGERYKAYVSFKLKSGYTYASGLTKKIGWADNLSNKKILEFKDNVLTFTCDITCQHDKDPESSVMTAATCISPEKETYYCLGCKKEIEDIGKIDPDAHDWSAWSEITKATTVVEGSRSHTCSYCSKEEVVKFPRLYSHVYEPHTSWTMSAAVGWLADGSALDVAKQEVRPGTSFVWLDKNLKVYDRYGNEISESVEEYVKATSLTMIPAFFIEDQDTARALKEWLKQSGLKDCFVAATPGKRGLVKDVADIVQVRGILDYSIFERFSKHDLADITDAVNSSHSRVIIISEQAATRSNISTLQAIGNTVWVKTSGDLKTLVTLYTDGVNGVVTEDFRKAYDAVEFFDDDAPTLLRPPLIIGHRGDPSNYAENTLESAKGAYSEGADIVECDVHLSKDGKLIIKHDASLTTLTGKDGVEIKSLPAADIKALSMIWDGEFGIRATNEVNSDNPTYGHLFEGKLFGENEGYEYKIPTLREYFEEFKDKDLIHAIEIKSYNQKTIKAICSLVNEFDLRDKVYLITFGQKTMRSIYEKYAGLSVGALSVNIQDYSEGYPYMIADQVCEAEGPEAALERICDRLDRWNASLNIPAPNKDMVRAARHRGITVWPWTYTLPDSAEEFADHYKFGMNGLTIDQPWAASDYIEQIRAEDINTKNIEDIPKPLAVTKSGENVLLENAELLLIEDPETYGIPKLAIWRYKETMTVNGENFGTYYLYSNPFTLTVIPEEVPVEEEDLEEEQSSFPAGAVIGIASAIAVAGGAAGIYIFRKKKKTGKGS